jgi:alpha-glucosidase
MICALVSATAEAAWEPAGAVTACRVQQTTVDCDLASGGRIVVDLYANDIVRVRVSPDSVLQDQTTGALVASARHANQGVVYDTSTGVFVVTPSLTFALFKTPLQLAMWRADGTLVGASLPNGFGWNRTEGTIAVSYFALPGERYLGFGERGGAIDRRGRVLWMKNTDRAGFTSQSDPLYISIPYFYALRDGKAAGVYVDSGALPYFDLDSSGSGLLTFGVASGDLDYYVMAGPRPIDVAKSYRQLTGPNQLPPLWTLGYHPSRYSYMSQNEVLSTAWWLRALQLPADVLYFDIDYLDQLRMFTWNSSTFPDPASMNLQLKAWGFHSVNIMEPLNHVDDPLRGWLDFSKYYLTGPTGESLVNEIWYGMVSWLDFSKAPVRDWYRAALRGFLGAYHIDGVWNDLNEPAQNHMPEAVYDFDGHPRTDAEARNLYALLEAQTSYEAQRELRPDVRPWVFSRSGFAGMHRYGANWGGDADTSFASLRANVEMSLSMGLSGQPFFGHDIGGFLGSPSPELFLRWMTFSAYTPLFRNHAINTSERREPWAFGEPYLSMARNIINERYRLIPYFYSLFHHDAASGQPVLSPLAFHFPADATAPAINDEFLLGPSLLVAPILEQGATSRWVYLPLGPTWIHERTGIASQGGAWVPVQAAVDQIPVFVRDGSIIPRAPVAQSTAEQPLNRRSLDVYCGTAAAFDLYEDDGVSFGYESGQSLLTHLACTPGSTTTLTITRGAGTWTPPADRQWRINLHRIATAPATVRRGTDVLPQVASEAALDAAAQGWLYDANQRLIIKVADQSAPIVITVQP